MKDIVEPLDAVRLLDHDLSMITPGWKLDWQPVEGGDEILVKVIPDRAERAHRLQGSGRKLSPDRDSVAELVAERAAEGLMAS